MEAFEERNNPRAEDEHGLPQPQEYKEPLLRLLTIIPMSIQRRQRLMRQ